MKRETRDETRVVDRPVPLRVLGVGGSLIPILILASACGEAPPPQAPPPTAVKVEVVDTTTVHESFEFVGTVEPYRRVEVRSPVAGIITARKFREGSEVKRGQVLYEIDRTVYAAALSGAKARLDNAKLQVERMTPLVADHAVAQQDYDNAKAELAQAQAAYDQAAKDLGDATVRAEIDGRVGRALLEMGGRVSGSGDLLTVIDQLDPIYVTFHPSSQQQLEWDRSPISRQLLQPGSKLGITVTLPDGSTLGRNGTLDYIDPVLNPATGTRDYRARFNNDDRSLLPGQFVRVKLTGFERHGVITIPQRAVQEQLGRKIVYTVGPGDTVAMSQVEVGQWVGQRWIIEKGVSVGDKVIVDGFQKTGPGAVVAPTIAPMPADTAQASTDSTP